MAGCPGGVGEVILGWPPLEIKPVAGDAADGRAADRTGGAPERARGEPLFGPVRMT